MLVLGPLGHGSLPCKPSKPESQHPVESSSKQQKHTLLQMNMEVERGPIISLVRPYRGAGSYTALQRLWGQLYQDQCKMTGQNLEKKLGLLKMGPKNM